MISEVLKHFLLFASKNHVSDNNALFFIVKTDNNSLDMDKNY